MGRPKLPAKETRTSMLCIRVNGDQKDWLRRKSRTTGTVTAFCQKRIFHDYNPHKK